MIAKLTGRIDSTGADWLVLDVAGVGYLVFCSNRTLAAALRAPAPVALHVETHVREDHIHLYGFADGFERDVFRLLTTVQGVGARMALAILSVSSPDQLLQAIAASDKAVLTRAAGVGPKLATRIVSELRDKVAVMPLSAHDGAPAGGIAPMPDGAAPDAAPGEASAGGAAEDAVSALVNLGYGRSEAFAAVARAARTQSGDAGVEALIREGLAQLSGREARA